MGGGKEGVTQSEGSVDNPTREGKGAVRYVEEGSPKGTGKVRFSSNSSINDFGTFCLRNFTLIFFVSRKTFDKVNFSELHFVNWERVNVFGC